MKHKAASVEKSLQKHPTTFREREKKKEKKKNKQTNSITAHREGSALSNEIVRSNHKSLAIREENFSDHILSYGVAIMQH